MATSLSVHDQGDQNNVHECVTEQTGRGVPNILLQKGWPLSLWGFPHYTH